MIADNLRRIARRNAWLLAAVVLVAGVSAHAVAFVRDASYEAVAIVLLQAQNVGQTDAGLGLTPGDIDPRRAFETELRVARSGELEASVRDSLPPGTSGGAAIEGDTEADVLYFRGEGTTSEEARLWANTYAAEFSRYRADLATEALRRTVANIESSLASDPDNAALRARLVDLQVQLGLTDGNTVTIESADDARQTNPRPIRDTLLGLSLGLVLGLLAVGAREGLGAKVRDVNDVADDVAPAPLLASIPKTRKQHSFLLGGAAPQIADAYSVLAAEVVVALEGLRRPLVAVTSSESEDGKTTVSVNTALALASTGRKVLLVDLDHRRAGASRLLGVPRDAEGLLDVAGKGGSDRGSITWRLTQTGTAWAASPPPSEATDAAEPAGSASAPSLGFWPPGSEAVGQGGVEELLSWAADTYEVVVIDCPPVSALPEIRFLSQRGLGIICTARIGHTQRHRLRQAVSRVREWPASAVIGAVAIGADQGDAYAYYS